MLTVFYRENSIEPNEIPLADLQFHHFPQAHSWENLINKDAMNQKKGCNVISLIQTPKNVGGTNNQFMWFTKGSNPEGTPCFKVLKRDDGNWQQLINEVGDWLNKYIPPHQLISVSIFEDAHENVGKGINACITHCAGNEPTDLSSNPNPVGGEIYSIETITSTGEWEDLFNSAKDKINVKGGQEGHMVASTNDSSNDGSVIIVISWSSLMEGNIRESTRPASCMDNCSIF